MAELPFPTERRDAFGRHAAAYSDGRPGYPSDVFDQLRRICGLGPGCQVVEVGPGAGQATGDLLEAGAEVTAVEMSSDLADILCARHSETDTANRLHVVVSSFEAAELPDQSFDLLAAATSFHWIDPDVGLDKAGRLLRPGGWLALWWTSYGDPTRPDPFHDALVPVLERHAPELVDDGNAGVDVQPYALDLAARSNEVAATTMFGPVEQYLTRWTGRHSADETRRLFASFSPWMALPDPKRNRLLDEVEVLADDTFGGVVERPYVTALYLAQRLPVTEQPGG